MKKLILLLSIFLVGCSIAEVKENFPRYGRYCGWGYSSNWKDGATINDAPMDTKDAVCWLHDAETYKSTRYADELDVLMSQNTASKFFNFRLNNQEQVKSWANCWWTKKTGQLVDIPYASYDEEWARVYKPGARRLFGFLYRPELRNDALLINSIDETLCGPPPKPD